MKNDTMKAKSLGRNTTLRLLDLPVSNELRDAFYGKSTDRDAAQVKAVWSRIIFTGQGQPPKKLPDAAAVKKADVFERSPQLQFEIPQRLRQKVVCLEDAVSLVRDGDTLAVCGFVAQGV